MISRPGNGVIHVKFCDYLSANKALMLDGQMMNDNPVQSKWLRLLRVDSTKSTSLWTTTCKSSIKRSIDFKRCTLESYRKRHRRVFQRISHVARFYEVVIKCGRQKDRTSSSAVCHLGRCRSSFERKTEEVNQRQMDITGRVGRRRPRKLWKFRSWKQERPLFWKCDWRKFWEMCKTARPTLGCQQRNSDWFLRRVYRQEKRHHNRYLGRQEFRLCRLRAWKQRRSPTCSQRTR